VNNFGLIAGNGAFPLEVAAAAKARGIAVIAVAHKGETSPEIANFCSRVAWIEVGQLQESIDTLKAAQVKVAAMAGGISRARLRASFKPDARALAMLSRIRKFSDDAVLRGVAAELEADGIEVIDPVDRFGLAVAQAGLLAGPEITASAQDDIRLGFAVARALGVFDVGQVVAARDGVVAAVEAIEGTDATLRRAASLAGAGLVIAKASKPGQDLRFDRPAIGPHTINLLHEIRAAVLAIEAQCTLIIEPENTLKMARELEVSVYGYN
jgi:DUF1009 family protein